MRQDKYHQSQMNLQIMTPFATPFGFARHPAPSGLNAELRRLFLEKEKDPSSANAKATMQLAKGLFESRFDLFNWTEPCVRELREFCWRHLHYFVSTLHGQEAAALSRIIGHADAWFHVTRQGGYFGLHNHPMASWSGVYCVDSGCSGEEPEKGGLLSFPHPNLTAAMFKDAANSKLRIPYGYQSREYFLNPGDLLLFPSWVPHQVTPFSGDSPRITVAFNAWFTFSQ